MPVTMETLDEMAKHGCKVPDCDHMGHEDTIFLHARCHIESPCEVSYTAGTGLLKVACFKCKDVIAEIAVAAHYGVN